MVKVTLQNLGATLRERRGKRGLREVSAEVGTSAPTLSRIESGKMPDLQTFSKLCQWLRIDPASVLGVQEAVSNPIGPGAAVAHLKAKKEIEPATARALAHAIMRAQMIIADQPEGEGKRGARI